MWEETKIKCIPIKIIEGAIVYSSAAIFFVMLLAILWCEEKLDCWRV